MIRLTLVTLLWIFASARIERTRAQGAPLNCTIESNDSVTSYVEWPILLSCKKLYDMIPFKERKTFSGMNATCTIHKFPSEELVSNLTIRLSGRYYLHGQKLDEVAWSRIVTENLSAAYSMTLEIGNACWYQIIELNKLSIPSGCDGHEAILYDADINTTQSFSCKDSVPDFFAKVKSDLKYRWAFKCNDTLPNNVVAYPDGSADLNHIGFQNAGKYVCYVQYLGREKATRVFDVCLKYNSVIHDPIVIKCPKKVSAPVGGDVSIECESDVATGKADKNFIHGTWFRETNLTKRLCDSTEGEIKNSTIEAEKDRIQCTMKSSIKEKEVKEKQCYSTPPIKDKYTITLTLKNLKLSDFGGYVIVHGSLAQSLSNRTIILTIDNTAEKQGQVRCIIGGTVAVVVFFIIILLLVIWKRKYFRWFWKKHCGAYETELLTYTAYFAYYYDYEREEESMKKTKSFIVNLHNFMDKFGGVVYDDARNHNVHRFDADNILQVQSDCHRIIVLITPEFLTDEWSRLKAYSAVSVAIESGRKTIFIYTSGSKKAIKNLDQSARTAITSAMKRNIVIEWDGKIPFSGEFKRELEYALPKFQKGAFGRLDSGSPGTQLAHVSKNASQCDNE